MWAAAFHAAARRIEQGSAVQAARGRFVQVVVSVPSTRVATKIARALLELRLCACAQTLGPITSHYRWKGKIERGREWLLVLKARATLLEPLEAEVRRLHPYDVPEILAVPIHSGHAPYLNWLRQECVQETPTPSPRER